MADSRIQVLLAIRTLSGGGAEMVVETLCRGLDPQRFGVTVCELVGRGEKARKLHELGYEVVTLLSDSSVHRAYLAFLPLRRLLGRRRIDVMHSHCAASLSTLALAKMLRPSTKLVHTFHFGNYPHQAPSALRLERMFHRFADALVAVGDHQAAAIRATYGLRDGATRTIWNGVPERPPQLDHARLRNVLGSDRPIIGTIGTLTEQKGHADLLEVAALMKQRGHRLLFLIVGGGDLHAPLEARARALDVTDCVRFTGWVKDAAETVLPAIDIFYQPSRWEAMSMVLLEAAAAARPIVCTSVGEATRVLQHGTSALIVEPGDHQGALNALELLLRDEALRRRLGAAARTRVQECCTANIMLARYEQLYRELLVHRALRPASGPSARAS